MDPHLTYDPPPPWSALPLHPYDAEVAFTDREMTRLLRRTSARLGPTVAVVISDHGEGLGEHREDEHGLFLYDTTVRVPFVVGPANAGRGSPRGSFPGSPGRVVQSLARNADTASILAALAGLPSDFPDGLDLVTEETARPYLVAESLSPTRYHGGAAVKALRTPTRKYVMAPEPEAYDLAADPAESRNLHGADPEADAEAHRLLIGRVRGLIADLEYARAEVSPVDEKRAEALEALGYITGGAEPDTEETVSEGIDPKNLVDVTRSVKYVMDGRFQEAHLRMERFWREHPADPPDESWRALYSRAELAEAFLAMARNELDLAEGRAEAAVELDPEHREAAALLQNIRAYRAQN